MTELDNSSRSKKTKTKLIDTSCSSIKLSSRARSLHDMVQPHFISVTTPLHKIQMEGTSIAARHTIVKYRSGAILCDAGLTSFEMGNKCHIILLTHGHSDHSRGVSEIYGHGDRDEVVNIFCPASIASNIFYEIKNRWEMNKGRIYSEEEILKMLRIIAIRKDNDTTTTEIIGLNNKIIAEVIPYGQMLLINLKGREQVGIQAFPCVHTVDTCGYVVSSARQKLANTIKIESNTTTTVNLTEDQDPINNTIDGKYKDVEEFANKHSVEIIPSIVPTIVGKGHTLYVRHLHFPNGLKIQTKKNNQACLLDGSDFRFFSKYKINIEESVHTPEVMFFGDTSPIVFNIELVRQLMAQVKAIIIECTFLEGRNNTDPQTYKDRQEKRHMFLENLIPMFNAYSQTDFVLIHFSAIYDELQIKQAFEPLLHKHKNIIPLI